MTPDTPKSSPSIPIRELNDDDKPREKALQHGISALSDTELLTIAIGSGMPGLSALDMARGMLRVAGGKLSGIRSQSLHAMIRSNPGIGPAKAVSIAAAFELGIRCRDEQPLEQPKVDDSNVAYNYIRRYMEWLANEQFWVMTLSRANRITGCFRVSDGGTAATVVDVKILMKNVVDRLASGIILAHNHPSGNMLPSEQDKSLTRKIKGACELFDIRLLDHIIVGPSSYISFLDKGLI
ncbi:MAG: DNA repair protein RadC [Pseudoflavonifractor sp.]|nr:DNA repair protein RadC [Alloprevotella sp.]MCM1116326.1 DNA repair protein RadC [Pseudoflavonifractor sp.]